MFEDGAKLDDILNVLKKPTLDKEGKKDSQSTEASLRYDSKQSLGDDVIKFEFAKQLNSGGLK